MTDRLQELLSAGIIPSTSYGPTSRYAETPVTAHEPGDGADPVPHLKRRFSRQPRRFATLFRVRITALDRRDTLAAQHIGDPEHWWRIADANGVIDPRELTDVAGEEVRITLAEDVPGGLDA